VTSAPRASRPGAAAAAGNPAILVESRGLRKSYGAHEVLKGIDLTVSSGEVVCIVGASGSGKSTFLRCINDLEKFDSGELTVDGEPVGCYAKNGKLYELTPRAAAARRARIGMVFQHFNLFPHMTVLQNIIEAPVQILRKKKSESIDLAMSLLERVGMQDRPGSYPNQLSGGQKQRVAIARALAMEPRLMLFDEPTSALDPELVGEVLAVMADLADSGMTMVIVTHQILYAKDIAQKIVYMDSGRVVEEGKPEELIHAPRNERTKAFMARVLKAH